jgi:pyruvate kinase
MSATKIITTIGPSSLDDQILRFFKNHSVEYARLNFSHSNSSWHIEAAQKCRQAGLKLLVDLGGPKIRLGELYQDTKISTGSKIVLEHAKNTLSYPYNLETGEIVIPVAVDLSPDVALGSQVLIDDGKLSLIIDEIEGERVICTVTAGGVFKSRKGVNLPESSIKISFLTDRDKIMLEDTLAILKPDMIACSFIKSQKDIEEIKDFIGDLIAVQNIDSNYFPKICSKLEQHELFDGDNLEEVIKGSDLLMIARGDLALEVEPIHIVVPFLQEKIERACRKFNKPFVVATQILESMISCPAPSRAEISDLYRAVMIDKADFIMLSGESAMGNYPKECVQLMDDMITKGEGLSKEILGEYGKF